MPRTEPEAGRAWKSPRLWLLAVLVGACLAPLGEMTAAWLGVAGTTADAAATGAEHHVVLRARQYGYQPHRIVVASGDRVYLRLASLDVVHGFYLEGHDLELRVWPGKHAFFARHPSREEEFREVEEVVFTAGRPGKYRYRCSITCGPLHPFMQGELIVRPNRPFRSAVWAAGAVVAATFGLMLLPGRPRRRAPWRLDLLRLFPRFAWLLERRWFQFALVAPMVVILFFFLIAGFAGSPIGNRNIIVTIVWIFWWFVLITLMVPFGGRVWCMLCPLPFFGEWFARRRLVGVRPEAESSTSLARGSLNRRWPRALSGLWVQNLLFLAMCSVSTILVTRPALTAAVLGGMLGMAVVVHAVFRRRSFCRYLCPLNAWMSLYSMTAMTEVRARDPELCAACHRRSCMTGRSAGGASEAWRCPWLETPWRMRRNNYCGLCMECIKACPNRNMTVNARPPCADTALTRPDEAWMAFIMITLVVAYSVTLLGPWGIVKEWANVTEVGNWGGFAIHTGVVWATALALVPGLWYLAALLGRRLSGSRQVPASTLFLRYAYLLVPLGLLAWMAFSFPLIMVNHSHISASLSDPLGWGWDLFGTADTHWRPLWPELVPYLQIPLLLFGLGLALVRGGSIARELYPDRATAARSLVPHAVACLAVTLVLLRLFVG